MQEQIYDGTLEPIGLVLTSGIRLDKIIADGRKVDPPDSLVFVGSKAGQDYVVKMLPDSSRLEWSDHDMKKLATLIPLYSWYLDTIKGDYEDSYVMVMEMLQPIQKDQVFDMLLDLIPRCFDFMAFMAHCDIKPDNVMYSANSNRFYFIDFDSICKEPLLYGYKRVAATPLFTSQTLNGTVIASVKTDLLELAWTAHCIYHGCSVERPIKDIWSTRAHVKARFGALIYLIWNMDERHVRPEDLMLLTAVVEDTRAITLSTPEQESATKRIEAATTAARAQMSNPEIYNTVYKATRQKK